MNIMYHTSNNMFREYEVNSMYNYVIKREINDIYPWKYSVFQNSADKFWGKINSMYQEDKKFYVNHEVTNYPFN